MSEPVKPPETADATGSPGRGKQALVSVGVSMLLSAALIFLFWQDIWYFVQKPEPLALGVAGETELKDIPDNHYVRIGGLTDPRVQYAGSNGKTYRYFILMGSPIIVEQELKSAITGEVKSFRYNGSGRILKLSEEAKYDVLLNHLKDKLRLDLKAGGYVMQDGVMPRDVWPYFAICCASIILTALSVIRFFLVMRS